MLVMGWMRESRQDLSRYVGMTSREQVELEDCRMVDRTSSAVAGRKSERDGGGVGGRVSGVGGWFAGRVDARLVILSLKNF